jgi:hypothetical protein
MAAILDVNGYIDTSIPAYNTGYEDAFILAYNNWLFRPLQPRLLWWLYRTIYSCI